MRSPHLGVGRWLRRRPSVRDLKADALAGLPGAIGSVPDGMAASVLAGVNPVYGLYASFAGPIAGGTTVSTRLMVIAPTSAAALAAGSALIDIPAGERPAALFLVTLLAGLLMLLAGLFRLGRYARFVSHSVMTGFLTGVAVNIVLGQLPDLTGVAATGDIALTKALDVVTHPSAIELAPLLTGLGAVAAILVLGRTRLAMVGALAAIVVPTAVVQLTGAGSVALVSDAGDIPSGVPLPALPELSLVSLELVAAAFSIAVIILVQGTGVAESVPNPDGTPSRTDVDFMAQGVGNVASGLFRGIPVGGSVGNTALSVSSGARTRWASILSGVWMLVILAAFSPLVGRVAMPTLAGLLIYAAVSSVKPREISTILHTSLVSAIAATVTFGATLFLPIQVAVGVGVALSLVLQLNTEALDLKVVRLAKRPDGTVVESAPPATLPSRAVTVVDVYGSLLYAGARTLQARLPSPRGSEQPVLVLRLRGRTSLGATFFVVLAGYARSLDEVGGRLYLSGVDPALHRRLTRTGRVDLTGPVRVFEATEVVGGSTWAAADEARGWLVRHEQET